MTSKEEHPEWISPHEVQFKVIMKELNVERKRYLLLNIKERSFTTLSS
jgi:hypothetical protein